MAFRYELIHHPKASEDYFEAREFFAEIDPGLAKLFEEDFRGCIGWACNRSLGNSSLCERFVDSLDKTASVHSQSFFRSDGEQQAVCFGGG
jgi:hypothetical protein